MNTLIFNAAILPEPRRDAFIPRGYIYVEKDVICEIGQGECDFSKHPKDTLLFDAHGRLAMPGLINAHTHLPMSLFKGLGEDLPLLDWLEKYMFPLEAQWVNPKTVGAGARLALVELIRSGVTACADMYYFNEAIGEAVHESGIRAWLGQTVMGSPIPDARDAKESFERLNKLLDRYRDHPRVTMTLSPHSTFTLGEAELRACARAAAEKKLLVQIHASESQAEQHIVARKYGGKTPVEVIHQFGLSDVPLVLAHGVYISESDIALMQKFKRVGIVHNPESNMKLGSGVAPIDAFLAAGIPVALGTDGGASNNNLDMFSEMDTASKLQKVSRLDPTAFTTTSVLEAATIGGARVLGVDKKLGSLEVGKLADIIFVDMTAPHMVPVHDVVANIVFCARAGDVTDVMVGGAWVMRGRVIETIDEQAVLEDAARIGREIGKFMRETTHSNKA